MKNARYENNSRKIKFIFMEYLTILKILNTLLGQEIRNRDILF